MVPAHLPLREAAAQLGVHPNTLRRAVRRGLLSPITPPLVSRLSFSPDELSRYVSKRQQNNGGYSAKNRMVAEAFLRATLLVTSELRPDVALRRLVEAARRLVGASYGALGIMDDEGRIRQFFTTGLSRSQRRDMGPLPEGKGLLGTLFQECKSLRISDMSQDTRSRGFPPNHPPMKSFLGVPIVSGGRNVGNIYLTDKQGATEFSPEDQSLIENLAKYAAVAIQNAKLYQRAKDHAQQWQILSNIARLIVSSLQSRSVLRQVVKAARHLLRADVACIALLDGEETLRIASWSGLKTQRMRKLRFNRDQGLGGAVLVGGEPLVVKNYATDDRLTASLKDEVGAEGLVSQVAVPLEARQQQLGVLYVGTRNARDFGSEEVELLRQLGSLVALAVGNAQLYEAERAAHLEAAGAEARLRAVIAHLPESVLLINPKRKVVLANPAAARILLGREDAHLDGRQYPFGLKFLHTDGRAMEYAETPAGRCLAGQGPCLGIELIVERRDGTRVPLLVNSAAITAADGVISSVVVVQQDISRLKEVEQLKEDFLSMITHDLKSPLTTIKVLASSIGMETQSDSVTVPVEWGRTIEIETDRLTDLVNNLLDMSRTEAGAMPLDREEFHILDLSTECVQRFQRESNQGMHMVHLDVPVDLPLVFADFNQIQRVILNLLSNAAKYSNDGTEIWIRARLSADGDALVVAVEDQGVGIPSRDQERIFEKFYRSPHQLGGRRQGSGLGLAICRALVEAHSGRLSVRSQPGTGSVFSFTLPLGNS
ncbi:MAG: multi-sensor signal transduction histidine kinase [Dehalococcoidia bacterium]|nr:multi-sensor signal transduction histidine kinase [Dehalococcoidia bacterium]